MVKKDPAAHKTRLPAGWDEKMSSSGKRYYVNVYTKKSMWSYPVLPEGWRE